MPPSTVEAADLLDLKLLPAWLREPAEPRRYADTEHEHDHERPPRHGRGKPKHGRNRSPGNIERRTGKGAAGRERRQTGLQRGRHPAPERGRRDVHAPIARPPQVSIRFVPYSPAFENVVTQIRSGSVAYSLFSLARLFLEKPVGYEVCLTANQGTLLHQLGDNGTVSVDREFLERNAFRFALRDFYEINVLETDPIKGNFSNIARCRLSGTLLGPTNYHTYQSQLRSLYEQRFSRQMSFADYQRQIEIVSDPALVEHWKEEARKVTTYTTIREETPQTFSSAAEAERHFRARYLPGLIRGVMEVIISGGPSRRLPDRSLYRAVEDAWTREARSPSKMMQELASRFRQNGLHVFRHRRGMLFVSQIRPRAFVHEQAGVSSSVNSILEALKASPTCNGKQLLDSLTGHTANEEAEPRRLALASDLRWLINERYVIEFNDGSLDLPRTKARPEKAAEGLEAAPSFSSKSVPEATGQLWIQWPLQLTWPEP